MPFASFNYGAVPFEVVNIDSPSFAAGGANQRLQATYKIDWRLWPQASRALLGYPTVLTAADSTKYISRSLPHQYLDWTIPSLELWCVGVSKTRPAAALPVADNNHDHPHATMFIDAVYEGLPYGILDDSRVPRVSQDLNLYIPIENAGEGTPPPPAGVGGAGAVGTDESWLTRYVEFHEPHAVAKIVRGIGDHLVYLNDDGTIPTPSRPVTPGYPIPYYEVMHPVTWHDVPIDNAPLDLAFTYVNKTNSVRFWHWQPRTVLLGSVRPKRVHLVNGLYAYKITYEFIFNPNGWDRIVDPNNQTTPGRYSRVGYRLNPARYHFQEADFRNLFRPV